MTYSDVVIPLTQIQRASSLTYGLLQIKKQLEDCTFPPDEEHDMAAYKATFHSCRMPHPTGDYTQFYPHEQTNHVIVMVNGQFYSFSTLDKDGKLLLPSQFLLQFDSVFSLEGQNNTKFPPVGLLATQNRTQWAHNKEKLLRNKKNSENFELIHKSAFIVVFDGGDPPVNQTEFSHRTWCGGNDIANRFYDSPLQLIIYKNGKAGIVGEHSRMDGQPVVVISDLLLNRERSNLTNTNFWISQEDPLPEAPVRLEWVLSPTDISEIGIALSVVQKEIDAVQLDILTLPGYGKNLWKKLKVSPDATVQIALQLTYFQLHQSIGATYESVSTSRFSKGRTETGRTVSNQLIKFVETVLDPNSTDQDKILAFKKASDYHVEYAREASKGFGVDRHLLGLKLLSLEGNLPLHPLFSSQLFLRSCHWNLSTSTLSPQFISSITFGPVVPDGYGICYTYQPSMLTFSTCSFRADPHTDSIRFNAKLSENLSFMKELFLSQMQNKSKL
eukprot:TRINITY_DN2745_c0_g2_i3.p1 TRINITY_DN2745_c0_g2~~TRINITY_DN2745_c0_g2_i3.p1  ORF type:complete len:500 (+),score=99.67 TRINITY_DN2745_c0_g2_i3:1308-2807(+)